MTNEPSKLEQAAENVVIAWEMGWEMDDVVKELRKQCPLFQNEKETEE